MFHREVIRDFNDPRLAPFRTMRAQWEHARGGVFVAEGDKVVRRLLATSFEVLAVLAPGEWADEVEPLLAARPESITLFTADKAVLTHLTGYQIYQGVLGLARVPSPARLEALLGEGRPRLWCALDGLVNSDNVGAVVRNAAAFGASALVVGETCAHPYLRRAVRVSMGTVFSMPYYLSGNLVDTLRILSDGGVRCLAADPRSGATPVWDADWTGDVCAVFGTEGDGLRSEIVDACDQAVALPMSGGVDSLNVASAAAAIFAEARRQRSGTLAATSGGLPGSQLVDGSTDRKSIGVI